ncbi:MAG: heme exporter protein CcmB [Anaerolineae bacterium]|nr:heme exporter protein CcmB [Anaerolineae bacterium]
MKTPFFTIVRAIIRKDLQAELRSKELIATMLLFALLSVLIFSFALELDRTAREEAVSGVLWVTVVFSSILGLNRSMAMEREGGNMDGMLLAPIDRSAVFVGKLFGNYVFALAVGLVLLPLMSILYNMNLLRPWLLVTLVIGTFGISTSGTLLAAMTVQTRSREALLPIVMLPVILPLLLGAVRATTGVANDAPVNDWMLWPQVIAVVDVIYLVLCYVTFPYVIEE